MALRNAADILHISRSCIEEEFIVGGRDTIFLTIEDRGTIDAINDNSCGLRDSHGKILFEDNQ